MKFLNFSYLLLGASLASELAIPSAIHERGTDIDAGKEKYERSPAVDIDAGKEKYEREVVM
ncbi:hypothetical protein V8E51_014710 [Hyaloscypha variabilis]